MLTLQIANMDDMGVMSWLGGDLHSIECSSCINHLVMLGRKTLQQW